MIMLLIPEKQKKISCVMRKHVFRVSDPVRHKPGCTVTEMARGLKFRIKQVKEYYLFSKHKGTDQLRGHHVQKAGFLMAQMLQDKTHKLTCKAKESKIKLGRCPL